MNRARLLLLLLLTLTGCGIGFDSPDIHITNATQFPKEAIGMKDTFRLPDDLTDVYYFSPQSLFCNYYLRGTLTKDAVREYETGVLKNAVEIPDIPADISGPEVAPIADWWPPSNSPHLRIYKVRNIDYVMIDHDEGFVYAVLCSE